MRARIVHGVAVAALAGVVTTSAGQDASVPTEGNETERPIPAAIARAAEQIRADGLMTHVHELCDPEMAGRPAGEAGARRAADYIAKAFRSAGLRPGGQAGSFYQVFKIRAGYRITSELELFDENESLDIPKRHDDYMPVHLPADAAEVDAACAVAGYGVSSPALAFDEYEGLNVEGKAVIVFAGAPWGPEAAGWIRRIDPRPLDTLAYKARNAAAHGAALLIVVDNPIGWRRLLEMTEQFRLPDRDFPVASPIPVIHVSRQLATRMTGMTPQQLRLLARDIVADRHPQSQVRDGRRVAYRASIAGRAQIGRNVVGILPGSDSTLRNEAVVIGAHYDHLGEGAEGVFWGANDNASGVSALLAISRAFATVPKPPRRSMVFIAFAAEEIGKLGSSHYTTQPSIPLDRTSLMINFDMIGRNEEDHTYAVATRSSRRLHALHQGMNRFVGLKLTHPERYRLGLSDHTAFYRAGVPVMYLFGGRHPGYHTPDDTPEKLVPAKIEKVARLAFLTAWAVAQEDEKLTFDGFHPE